MPYKPKTPCQHPGCPELVAPGTRYCAKHLPLHPEVTRSASGRGYGSRWQRESKRYLESHPLCVQCMKETPLATPRRRWSITSSHTVGTRRSSGTGATGKLCANAVMTARQAERTAVQPTDTDPAGGGLNLCGLFTRRPAASFLCKTAKLIGRGSASSVAE